MSAAEALRWVVVFGLVGVVSVVLTYAAVRGASFAYFRTRYEFWQRTNRELKKKETKANGSEI